MKTGYIEFYDYIRSYCREFLPEQRKLSIHTIRYYRDTLNRFIEFLKIKNNIDFKGLSIDMITPLSVSDFLAWLSNRGNSISTCNRRLAAIKIFMSYITMIDESFYSQYARIKAIKFLREPNNLVEFLTKEEIATLLRRPDTTTKKGLRDSLLLILMYETAGRVSEVSQMCFSDFVESDTGCAVIIKGKGNKTRIVPISRKVFNNVQLYRITSKGSQYIFSSNKNHITASNIYKIVSNYGKLIGLKQKLHPHLIRHTRAMHWYQGGMALEMVAQLLGHAHLTTTRIYARADIEMKRSAIEQVDEVHFNAVDESNHELFDWEDENLINRLCGLT